MVDTEVEVQMETLIQTYSVAGLLLSLCVPSTLTFNIRWYIQALLFYPRLDVFTSMGITSHHLPVLFLDLRCVIPSLGLLR